MVANTNLPFYQTVIAGGGAGVCEIALMYPTDVVKTRQQLSSGKTPSFVTVLRNIVRQEGAHNLYRGVLAPIFAEAPKRAIKFSFNEKYKNAFRGEDGSLPLWAPSAAGALAGTTECSVNTPAEVIKVRMQAKENLGRFKSTAHCAVELVSKEGVMALYTGLMPQVWRNAVWNGTYFGIIGSLKQGWFKTEPQDPANWQMFNNFMAGVVGGTIATCLNTPFDVVKSRIQNQQVVEGQVAKFVWTFPSLYTVASEEGIRALYKGLGSRLIRLGPGGGIMLVAFNFIVDLLNTA